MIKVAALVLTVLGGSVMAAAQGQSWVIQLEEPTGIERRDNEAVRLVATFAAGVARSEWLRVLDNDAHEVPVQVVISEAHADGSIKSAEILFPASLIPGRRPRYRLLASPLIPPARQPGEHGGEYVSDIVARHIGTSRFELGNSRFGIIVNLGKDNTTPAIVEAYNRTSGEHRMLNLVETSPDLKEELPFGMRSAGWGTALDGAASGSRPSGFTDVDVIESGPLRARVRFRGARPGAGAEEWEFEWYANSPVIVWRARTQTREGHYGFFFSAVSAYPYEPFTHWAAGAEVGWPDGDTDNPPHKKISPPSFLTQPQNVDHLPGGHILYYNPQDNYGALDFMELDPALKWFGVGSRQFYAVRDLGAAPRQPQQTGLAAIKRPEVLEGANGWSSQIAIAFPSWKGNETLLEARACYASSRNRSLLTALTRSG